MLFGNYDLVKAAMPSILESAKHHRNARVEPTFDEQRAVREFVLSFVRRKRRVVYGGTALNMHLNAYFPEEIIYNPDALDNPDLEFYSPRAMDDIVELCDALYEAGHRHVEAKLAMHDGTYSVHVNMQKYCDITYMPANLYAVLPATTMADDIRYVHPHFMAVDYMRVMNDPFTCSFRLEKDMDRLHLLDRCFPLALPSETFPKGGFVGLPEELHAFLQGRETVAVVGRAAYEFFVAYAGDVPVPKGEGMPLLEVVSVDFKRDVIDLHERIKEVHPGRGVEYQEHHRFYDFKGHTGVFSVGGRPYAIVVDYDHRFVPTLGEQIMGTFSYVLMASMIANMWHRAIQDPWAAAEDYATMARHMMVVRTNFLATHGLSVLSATPFEDFNMSRVIGEGKTAIRIKMIRNKLRERRGRPMVMKYRAMTSKDHLADFRFDNTSGKVANNPRERMYRGDIKTPVEGEGHHHGNDDCVDARDVEGAAGVVEGCDR